MPTFHPTFIFRAVAWNTSGGSLLEETHGEDSRLGLHKKEFGGSLFLRYPRLVATPIHKVLPHIIPYHPPPVSSLFHFLTLSLNRPSTVEPARWDTVDRGVCGRVLCGYWRVNMVLETFIHTLFLHAFARVYTSEGALPGLAVSRAIGMLSLNILYL